MSAQAIGRRVGGGLGWVAAKAVTVSIATAQGAGRFGEGVVAGAEETYVATRTRDDAAMKLRAAAFEQWKAGQAARQQHPLTMAVG